MRKISAYVILGLGVAALVAYLFLASSSEQEAVVLEPQKAFEFTKPKAKQWQLYSAAFVGKTIESTLTKTPACALITLPKNFQGLAKLSKNDKEIVDKLNSLQQSLDRALNYALTEQKADIIQYANWLAFTLQDGQFLLADRQPALAKAADKKMRPQLLKILEAKVTSSLEASNTAIIIAELTTKSERWPIRPILSEDLATYTSRYAVDCIFDALATRELVLKDNPELAISDQEYSLFFAGNQIHTYFRAVSKKSSESIMLNFSPTQQ